MEIPLFGAQIQFNVLIPNINYSKRTKISVLSQNLICRRNIIETLCVITFTSPCKISFHHFNAQGVEFLSVRETLEK